jgi:hypothetical protein
MQRKGLFEFQKSVCRCWMLICTKKVVLLYTSVNKKRNSVKPRNIATGVWSIWEKRNIYNPSRLYIFLYKEKILLNTCDLPYRQVYKNWKDIQKRLYTDYDKEDGLNRACNDNVTRTREDEQCEQKVQMWTYCLAWCSQLGQAAAALLVPFIMLSK